MRKYLGWLTMSVGLVALAGCGSSSSKSGSPAAAEAEDAGTLDASSRDAAVADASTPDGGLVSTACTPITNAGCEGGSCFTTSIDLMGHAEFACGPAGAGSDYTPCASSLDCKDLFSCLELRGEADRVCHQYCTPALQCPGGSTTPEACISFDTAGTLGYCFRVTPCNLFSQDCASADGGQGCYPVSSGGQGCLSAGTRALGSGCNNNQECAPGSICVSVSPGPVDGGTEDASVSGACLRLCNPAAATSGCSAAEHCTALTGTSWGFCK